MAQKFLGKTERRDLHFASGEMHPSSIARAARALKRGHRRIIRRERRRTLQPDAVTES